MTRRIQVLAILSGVLMSLAGAAMATAVPFGLHNVAVSGARSDSNMRWARQRIEENIDMLQRDQHDYNGYRVRAISLFQAARLQIELGIRYDNGREDVPPPAGFVRPDADMVYVRGPRASDVNLNLIRRNVERIMNVLAREKGDYAGHRVAALKLLDEGREMLKAATAWDASH